MTTPSKSVANQDLIVAARHGLVPVQQRARLGGFGNMLRKELGQWWGTRTWWMQILIWVLILNGINTIVMLNPYSPNAGLQEVVQTFLPMSFFLVGTGIVIVTQGAIVGEKQLGTAAWVMSKPASRAAFILAKTIAYAIGIWVTALIIPTILFVFTVRMLVPTPLALIPFLSGVAVAALGQLFYLSLTIMLGTFFNSRGPVAGIGIGLIIAGSMFRGLIPMQILVATPWPLPDIAAGVALGTPMPSIWPVPLITTGIWILVMTAVALWRFEKEEF